MNTITVENTQYEFQDIPSKGKCLVPLPRKVEKFNSTNVKVGSLINWIDYEYLICRVDDYFVFMRTKSPYNNVGEINNPKHYSIESILSELNNVPDYELVRT